MPATPDYPRDLYGYGRHPPHADWPGGARVAVQFVLNLEEGGENCVLHGDAASEQFLSELVGAAAYPARHLSMESVYEYGTRVGAWRILREFERRGLPLTVFGVSTALQRSPEVTAAVRELGSRNITVNCVAPGFIDTDMTKALSEEQHASLKTQIPLGRLGQPEDIAEAVAYLASPQAGYVTGQEMHVNGGMFMN